MQSIQGIEVDGHEANGGEGGRNLAGHDAALADPGHHQLGALLTAALQAIKSGLSLIRPQLLGGIQKSLSFLLQDWGQGIHHRPIRNGLKLKRLERISL